MSIRVQVTETAPCPSGRRYGVRVTLDGSPIGIVDAVGRDDAVRCGIVAARATIRMMRDARRGADIR